MITPETAGTTSTVSQPQPTKRDSGSSIASVQLTSPASSEPPTQKGFTVEAASLTTANDIQMEKVTGTSSQSSETTAAHCWPLVNDGAGAAASTKSTLNPEAKEFHVPMGAVGFAVPAVPNPMDLHAMLQNPLLYCQPAPMTPMAMPWPPSRGGIANDGMIAPPEKNVAARWPASTPSVRVMASHDSSSGNSGSTAANTQNSVSQSPQSLTSQIMLAFASECSNYHIVAVFNLESRTTKEELLNIFFPMNAKKAEILPQHFSLRPNRRAGAVFFPSKAFAAVAVEKFNDFVPNGQHQPLRVIYCDPEAPPAQSLPVSPDATRSVTSMSGKQKQQQTQRTQQQPTWGLSSSAKPWRLPPGTELYKTHMEMCRFIQSNSHMNRASGKHVVAIHGLDPEVAHSVLSQNFIQKGAECFDMWPPKSCSFATTPMACSSVSALVYYNEEATAMEAVSLFQLKPPEGQAQPIDVVHLNKLFDFHPGGVALAGNQSIADVAGGNDTSATYSALHDTSNMAVLDEIDDFFKRTYSGRDLFLVGVHNLLATMDKKSLFALFSRYGALSAEIFPDIVQLSGGPRRSGLIFFDKEGTARDAAEKLNGSYAKGQLFPMVARYLSKPSGRDPVSGTAASEAAVESGTMLKPFRRNVASDVNDLCARVGNNALLREVVEELHANVVDVNVLTDKMQQLLTNPEATEKTAEQLATALTDTLIAFGHHAQALSTPLVNALLSLHEKMRIPRRGGRDNVGVENGEDPDLIMGRNIIFISKIARSLVHLFISNDKPDESRKVAAVLSAYLFQYCYLKKSPYELAVKIIKEHEVALRSAKEFERSRPLSTKPAVLFGAGKGEEDVHKPCLILLACLEEFTSLWRKNNKSRAKKDPYRKEYDHCLEGLLPLDSAQGGGNSSLCASARPTPRRVIEKVTPVNANGTSNSSPGLTYTSPSSHRVTTRGEPMDISSSHDVSVECASPHSATPVSLPHGDASTPSMFFRHCGSSAAMSLIQKQVQQQQQHLQQQQQQQHRASQVRPQLSEAATGLDSAKTFSGPRGGGYAPSVYTQAELMDRTVYITKLPSTLRRAQFRRLLTYFGELNKVRLCRDENQVPPKGDITGVGRNGSELGAPAPTLWFSFVEFAEPSSSKAIVEYFRNATFTSKPFSFLLDTPKGMPEASYFTVQDIQSLLNVRTSPARNPIHDQLSLDAVLTYSFPPVSVVCTEPCRFGIEHGEKTIDSAIDASPFSAFGSSCNMGLTPAARMRVTTKPLTDVQRHQPPVGTCGEQTKDADASDDDSLIEDIMDRGVKLAADRTYAKGSREMPHEASRHTTSFDSFVKEMCGKLGEADVREFAVFGDVSQQSMAPANALREKEPNNYSMIWGSHAFGEVLMDDGR
ncbi:RNA-binding protein, putative [Trypanosoma brucei gambiense DAL972]|uniref:RNA-binding protein, putative n=1 Tax=Trypanosoma brucei gambiense (strain MHOM/CI/86/DAL972) TaxID=679716 RepID=C9ZUJ1_TRYB9|nr:RNA-binding protein, putative [Trypanosoma brucei gambiense DAL972]CBH13079.1 RNA-binding protein, putative [Trypanosoma brucei gambiense DAL972]|eukprot:XP_011775356.1 RNA-binding protein, putative [Trypanosoma brucei gambiense DAL972]